MTAVLVLVGALVAANSVPGPPPVTFTEHIAPIILTHCVPCHRADGPAPFSLVSYDDVRSRGRLVADAISRRYMPPWKPDHGEMSFVSERRLTNEQIELISRWTNEGYAHGDPSRLGKPPRLAAGWQLGIPDLVLTLPSFTLPADGSDRFRTFVLRVPGRGTRFVKGFEFRPGSRAVHHATIRVDATPASRALDEADPEPGYEGLIPYSAKYPDGHFLGWTPGQIASLASPGLAWQLHEGVDLAVHVHLRPMGRPELIRSTLAFYFTDEPPALMPSMLRLGRQDIDIEAGLTDYVSSDSFELPVDAQMLAIQPHSHYRARAVTVWAALPNGARRVMLRISDWDFNWQEHYRYKEPFWLPAGTRVTLEYRFDNSAANPRNPASPPARTRWGFRSEDEMGDVWIQMLTRTDADRLRLEALVRDKMLRDEATGCELQLQVNPDHVGLRNDAAQIYLELGQPERALIHSAAVARLRPLLPSAHYNHGVVLQALRLHAEAAEAYARAIALEPSYVVAQYNYALTLEALHLDSAAISAYERVLHLDGGHSSAHNNLGSMLFARGAVDEAQRHFSQAVASDRLNAEAHMNLGRVYLLRGQTASAVGQFRAGLKARPDCATCVVSLAWLLAAHADVAIRQPEESVSVARHAVALLGDRSATALDALAAAYASTERFEDAVRTALSAARLAQDAGNLTLASEIRERIQMYRTRRPFVIR